MIELNIPGRGIIQLEHLVTDVGGSLTLDGRLAQRLTRILPALSDRLQIHLVTADTHGQQHLIDRQLGMQATRVDPGEEAAQKADYVHKLGPSGVAAIGQGANDAAMLKAAALGVGILCREGLAVETLLSADLLVPDIYAALELFENPLRIVASLRQ